MKQKQLKKELNDDYEKLLAKRRSTNYKVSNVEIYEYKSETRYDLLIGILSLFFGVLMIIISQDYILLLPILLLILGILIYGIGLLIKIFNEQIGIYVKYISICFIIWGTI